MQAVLELLSSLADMLRLWLRRRYGERRDADRSAVRDDPSGRWLQSMGGTDRRDKPGPPDAGSHRDD